MYIAGIPTRHAGSIILRIAYGYIAKDRDDPFIEAGNTAMASFNAGCKPGAYMVNQMPIRMSYPNLSSLYSCLGQSNTSPNGSPEPTSRRSQEWNVRCMVPWSTFPSTTSRNRWYVSLSDSKELCQCLPSSQAAGTAEDSFTSRWLQKKLSAEDEDILIHASGSMFGGGGETVSYILF